MAGYQSRTVTIAIVVHRIDDALFQGVGRKRTPKTNGQGFLRQPPATELGDSLGCRAIAFIEEKQHAFEHAARLLNARFLTMPGQA